jgi:predicted nuclease with TOPRIM domain
MPAKKRPTSSSPGGPVLVILEEIRSQNRATIETVEARHQEARRDLQDFRTEVRNDLQVVQGALQAHREDIRALRAELAKLNGDVSRLDAVITADYRERLHRLEQRVEALERRPA